MNNFMTISLIDRYRSGIVFVIGIAAERCGLMAKPEGYSCRLQTRHCRSGACSRAATR
jgi:hypothetical protein